ncbi:MAG: leucyl aminopeptidase [Chromatiales bacterium]|nr:leucyl aminopeptidase [Chromatiales bacterium]
MELSLSTGKPETLETDCLIVGLFEDEEPAGAAADLDDASGGGLSRMLSLGDIRGKAGETLLLHDLPAVAARRVVLTGCGKRADLTPQGLIAATAAAMQALAGKGVASVTSCLTDLPLKERDSYWKIRFQAAAAEDAVYRYETTKSRKSDSPLPSALALWLPSAADRDAGERAVRDAAAIAAGSRLTRDLSNLPGNICTPTYLAEQAQALGATYDRLTVSVLEEEQMQELGMGSLLSVSRGSRQPAKLIVMHYRGAGEERKPIALVGKGLTFDAGGISLKPAADMDEMKYDMCGGASVFGAVKACCELNLPINLVGIVPSSENLPDGEANKPGDIVTSMAGLTIEILNTDAEGRLILCDALSYCERFEPEVTVDIATLTGACVIALGAHACGLFANDQGLADELLDAGNQCADRAWQLPLWPDYQKQLDSNFADMANVGGRQAGAVTAACFLSRFTDKQRWAHLDIAGVAWKSGKEKGATGRPVALLSQYLLDRARAADVQ